MHQGGLDRVLFMPAGDPWQKSDRVLTGPDHRMAMVKLAVEGVEGFEADDRELVRGGPTYTLDTLGTFPDEEQISLILGSDAAVALPTWHRYSELLERVRVLVAPRGGVTPEQVDEVIPTALILDMEEMDISGTRIREAVRTGAPFRFLVPEAVYHYIVAKSLYTEEAEHDMVEGPTDLEERS